MDYEKRYKEAKNRAIEQLSSTPMDKVALYYIFPELRPTEDERIRKDLIADLQTLPLQGVLTHRPTSEYIAYLEKQKEPENVSASTMAPSCWETKQMPADWTDKDKRILDDISHLLIMFKYTEMAKAYKQAIEKLIYQPHWKPSEEQMKALQNAVALTACDKELARLYNQLKKL